MDWLALVGSVLGAGGISALITALVSRKKNNADDVAYFLGNIENR
jgi:hypothetical protein